MHLNGSRLRVLSGLRIKRDLHCASVFCWIPSSSLNLESTSPAIEYACGGNYSFILNVQHPYRTMPSQSPHPDSSLVVRNIGSLANHQNQQNCVPSGNIQLLPAKRRVSILAGQRDYSHGGSSVASTIEGQNSTPQLHWTILTLQISLNA